MCSPLGRNTSGITIALTAKSIIDAEGNAYGSNITNIALILGVTALISPITVHSQVLRRELPILTVVTALAACQLWDGEITRFDAIVLLAVFGGLMAWTIWQGMQEKADAFGSEMEIGGENRFSGRVVGKCGSSQNNCRCSSLPV